MAIGDTITMIVNLGFSVFVAAFLLIKFDKTIESLNSTIQSLETVIKDLTTANEDNFDEAETQTELLRSHDQKLDNLIVEIDKIPKRGEDS